MADVPNDADAILARRIIRQAFTEWKAEQDAERRKWFGVAPAWFGVAALVVGPLVGGGVLYAQIQDTAEQTQENKRSIKEMADDDRVDDTRLTTIEVKLDMILQELKKQ